jgi:hypothetical protein
MCNVIPCFNGERKGRDKYIKGIKERKEKNVEDEYIKIFP